MLKVLALSIKIIYLLTKTRIEYIIFIRLQGGIAVKRLISGLCVLSLLFMICACAKDDASPTEPQATSDYSVTANTENSSEQQSSGNDTTAAVTKEAAVTLNEVKNTAEHTTEQTATEKEKKPQTSATTAKAKSNKEQTTAKSNSGKQDKNTTTTKKQEQTTTTTACKHQNTITKNVKKQTCTESGYSGDIYCTDCGKCIEKGEVIEADGHLSVEVYNIIQPTKNAPGYSGDKRCRICGTELEKGEVIPKLAADPEPVSHNNAELEYELLNLLNAERAKEGYAPLAFNENAYRCAKLRTAEIMVKFSHERPLGGYFDSILTNDGVSYSTAGENIQRGTADNTAQQMVDAFMNSEAHRANIMNNKYTSAAICVEYAGGAYYVTQIFIG